MSTIEQLVGLEWQLFSLVENEGGRAPCQDDVRTFYIMRSSQFQAWSQEMVESYTQDLQEAMEQGRNLLTEKYAYMMERTDPQGYQRIAQDLPPRSAEKVALVDEICVIQNQWSEEMIKTHPYLVAMGRPTSKEEDGMGTSVETYLWGELATYSEKTLQLYCDYVKALQSQGRNLNAMILAHTVHHYGLGSLDDAEQWLRGKCDCCGQV